MRLTVVTKPAPKGGPAASGGRSKGQYAPEPLPAIRTVRSPHAAKVLSRVLLTLLGVLVLALTITPWQQNITGNGRVSALDPNQRQQNLESPVDGRVVKWHVIEGSVVSKGDLIVEVSDNDPLILDRLDQERSATRRTIDAERDRANIMRERIAGLELARTNGVAAARARVAMSVDRVRAAEQGLQAAEAANRTATLNLERQKRLAEKGLTSTRSMELAELDFNKTSADLDQSRATLNAAINERMSMEAELQRVDNEAQVKIDEARGSLASAVSSVEKATADLTKVDVRVARQQNQEVRAPADGTILRVLAREGGEQVKSGDVLAVMVPSGGSDIVELWVSGNDAPLIFPGAPVRLQFEGWPAIQFSGWPSVAIGTFGGQVVLVDPTDNGQGKFRVLVAADPEDDPWPSRHYLRQGVRANGWVLLNQVSLGFELWRQFNGFPPSISEDEPGLGHSFSNSGGRKK